VALNAAETASNVPLNKETANQRKGKLLFGQAEFKADSENIQLKLPAARRRHLENIIDFLHK